MQQDNNNGRQLVKVVDHETGEVTSREVALYPDQEEDIVLIKEEKTPEFIIELMKMERDKEDLLAILSIFENGSLVRFTKYVGQEVNILGAIIWHHPAFYSRSKKDENNEPLLMAGYDQIRLLTDKRDENDDPIIVIASYGALSNHVRAMLAVRGWYLWDKPVKYRFKRDENTNSFQLIDVDRVKNLLPKPKK